jgi:hypothetical protein
LSRGYDVFVPCVDSGCDLVVSKDGVLTPCQVRSSRYREKNSRTIGFDLRQPHRKRNKLPGYGNGQLLFTAWLLVWAPTLSVYVVPCAELSNNQQKLRLSLRSKYKNNWSALG